MQVPPHGGDVVQLGEPEIGFAEEKEGEPWRNTNAEEEEEEEMGIKAL